MSIDPLINELQQRNADLEREIQILRARCEDQYPYPLLNGQLSKDEHALLGQVMQLMVNKMLGEGRAEYGALVLSQDTRSVEYCLDQAKDEIADGLFWMALAAMKGAA